MFFTLSLFAEVGLRSNWRQNEKVLGRGGGGGSTAGESAVFGGSIPYGRPFDHQTFCSCPRQQQVLFRAS